MLNTDYQNKFASCSSSGPIPTAFELSNMYLHDGLPFESTELPGNVSMDLLTPMINPSRVLSYSMYIEPIHRLRDILNYEQLLGLALLGSWQASPIFFNYSVRTLEELHRSEQSTFRFGKHPFYDVVEHMIETFGNWQCSLKARFSPCGGEVSIPEIFGFGAFAEHRKVGEQRLVQILNVLYDYTEWLDGLTGKSVDDLPLSYLKEQQRKFIDSIERVALCQMDLFRLGVCTTILTGSGMLKAGEHLLQLGIPAEGLASAGHLNDAKIPAQYHDAAMEKISHKLGLVYSRFIMETLLVSLVSKRVHSLVHKPL